MKRRFALLLFVLMLVAICSSCAAEIPEIMPEYSPSLSDEAIDLAGKTYIMAMEASYEGRGRNLGYIPDTDFGDMAAERVKNVETAYNCKIEFVYENSMQERSYRSAVGGVYLYDFVQSPSFGLLSYMRANAFEDLSGLTNIDVFDQSKWGNRYSLVSTMYNGGIFAVQAAALPLRVVDSEFFILYINEDHIAENLSTDPRDYYENAEWNWDTFERCLEAFAYTNSANQYIYSFFSGFGPFARDLGLSNGTEVVSRNSDGEMEIGYFSDAALEAYNKAFEWFNGALADNVLDYWQTDRFIAGDSVMYYGNTNQVLGGNTNTISYNVENYGVVPLPTGPNAKNIYDNKMTYSSASLSIAIPITAQDSEISALLIDKIYEPFEGFETKESILDYLVRNYFHDERDAKVILEQTQGDHMRYHVHMEMSGMFDGMMDAGIVPALAGSKDAIYKNAEKSAFPAYATLFENEGNFHD